MVKEIVRDVFFLSQKSEPATKDDIGVGRDLIDTLSVNKDSPYEVEEGCLSLDGVRKTTRYKITIRMHAHDFIEKRLAPANPENDGKQTPMKGHPVFLAQGFASQILLCTQRH